MRLTTTTTQSSVLSRISDRGSDRRRLERQHLERRELEALLRAGTQQDRRSTAILRPRTPRRIRIRRAGGKLKCLSHVERDRLRLVARIPERENRAVA